MKLSKFSVFVNFLFPHELKYLESIEKFENNEIRQILNRIRFNVNNPEKTKAFFYDIDKRKYSYLMKWIKNKLELIDVDVFFEWIMKMEKDISIDNVFPEDEKKVLNYTKTIKPTSYYFMRFYEMLNTYGDFLLIRTRILYYKSIQTYLHKYESEYNRAVDLNKEINKSAIDIINHYVFSTGDSNQCEKFLLDTFLDKSIDGFTRYKALIRLTYIYYNYYKFDELKWVYVELDKELHTSTFYSKRILANYYSNNAMMHSVLYEMDLAEYYAYLSIRQKNSDYLSYIIKLCNILIINNKNQLALKLMTNNISELKTNNSVYAKIGFVSVYIKVLNKNLEYAKGEKYGNNFLSLHKKDLFSFRWHIFFCAYLMSLIKQEKYKKLLSIEKKYKLVLKEKEFFINAQYVPTIQWYIYFSQYMEGRINEKKLQKFLISSREKAKNNKYLDMIFIELEKDLFDINPNVFSAPRVKQR
ncbi:MAG: hypothetical protein B7C24_06080 [Bacteroidetes bacterium 4572_77]|nr:MAG: hypothetical protein B7C24_06080 [Bacteroidetes bacterium 4572_77]